MWTLLLTLGAYPQSLPFRAWGNPQCSPSVFILSDHPRSSPVRAWGNLWCSPSVLTLSAHPHDHPRCSPSELTLMGVRRSSQVSALHHPSGTPYLDKKTCHVPLGITPPGTATLLSGSNRPRPAIQVWNLFFQDQPRPALQFRPEPDDIYSQCQKNSGSHTCSHTQSRTNAHIHTPTHTASQEQHTPETNQATLSSHIAPASSKNKPDSLAWPYTIMLKCTHTLPLTQPHKNSTHLKCNKRHGVATQPQSTSLIFSARVHLARTKKGFWCFNIALSPCFSKCFCFAFEIFPQRSPVTHKIRQGRSRH